MVNIDKNKINEDINEAYNNQTESVKKLLQFAKQNINTENNNCENYTVDKKNVKQLYMIRKLVDTKKEQEKSLLEGLDVKFNEMSDKLDVNSKNLDFIFKSVAEKNDKEIERFKSISEEQQKNNKEIIENISDAKEQINKNSKFVIELKENLEEHLKNIQVEDIIKIQQESKDEILKSQNELKNGIITAQNQSEKRIINNLETSNINSESKIIKIQKESESKILDSQLSIQRKMEQLQKENDQKIENLKQELLQIYKKNDSSAAAMFIEEKNAYINELQQKDRQIRELNYKIYAYEEKLEKEMARKQRFSIFSSFYRRDEVQEEQPVYACQILNAVY